MKGKKYKIVEKKDISYPGVQRMTYKIVISKSLIEQEIKSITTSIWEKGNKKWDDFTVFVYLPDMDTKLAAYFISEFNKNRAYSHRKLKI